MVRVVELKIPSVFFEDTFASDDEELAEKLEADKFDTGLKERVAVGNAKLVIGQTVVDKAIVTVVTAPYGQFVTAGAHSLTVETVVV